MADEWWRRATPTDQDQIVWLATQIVEEGKRLHEREDRLRERERVPVWWSIAYALIALAFVAGLLIHGAGWQVVAVALYAAGAGFYLRSSQP